MKRNEDPSQEGHTREWADRARVEMDPKEDVRHMAFPTQSPDYDDIDRNDSRLGKNEDEPVY